MTAGNLTFLVENQLTEVEVGDSSQAKEKTVLKSKSSGLTYILTIKCQACKIVRYACQNYHNENSEE